MNSILINYKIVKSIDEERLKALVLGCISKNYNVILNIYDFSLTKNIQKYITGLDLEKKIKISVIEKDYEDAENADKIILQNLIPFANTIATAILPEGIILNNLSLDQIDFDKFKNEIIGFLYFDYTLENIKCFMKSRSNGLQISIPAIFWSTKKLLANISNENLLQNIASNSASIHLAKNLCTIYANES